MAFVLELQFDSPSEMLIKGLMQQLGEIGLPSNLLTKNVSPHLTLLSSETLLDASTLEKLDKLLESQTMLSLHAVSLGTFANEQGVLCLGVVATFALLAFHQSVHACVPHKDYQPHLYYLPDRWVPHITLATNLTKAQMGEAVAKLELTLPQGLRVSHLALVRYPAPLKLLKSWVL
jgi:2'-5' RNA ligase